MVRLKVDKNKLIQLDRQLQNEKDAFFDVESPQRETARVRKKSRKKSKKKSKKKKKVQKKTKKERTWEDTFFSFVLIALSTLAALILHGCAGKNEGSYFKINRTVFSMIFIF